MDTGPQNIALAFAVLVSSGSLWKLIEYAKNSGKQEERLIWLQARIEDLVEGHKDLNDKIEALMRQRR